MGEKMEVINDKHSERYLKKFNWGAFISPISWGFGNKCYLTLLTLVPVLNIVWVFVCGFQGNRWAYKNGNYASVDELKMVQDTWNRAGLTRVVISLAAALLYLLLVTLAIIPPVEAMNLIHF